jgi:hypothetical protein
VTFIYEDKNVTFGGEITENLQGFDKFICGLILGVFLTVAEFMN